eukprot:2276541-Rhodomonas_salina.1
MRPADICSVAWSFCKANHPAEAFFNALQTHIAAVGLQVSACKRALPTPQSCWQKRTCITDTDYLGIVSASTRPIYGHVLLVIVSAST